MMRVQNCEIELSWDCSRIEFYDENEIERLNSGALDHECFSGPGWYWTCDWQELCDGPFESEIAAMEAYRIQTFVERKYRARKP